jgi:hypothetical protein
VSIITMKSIVLLALIAAFAAPFSAMAATPAALTCAGGFFSFSNTLCPAQMQLRICLGDRGNSLLFTLRKGESVYFQTAPNSSFSWSCNGEPAAMCPSAYCVNGSS